MTEGVISETHSISFSEKRLYERAWGYLKYVPQDIPTFLATAMTLWGFSEIIIAPLTDRPDPGYQAVPILGTAIVVTLYRAWSRYSAYVPTMLERESNISKDIYKKQKFGWQYALAAQMLSERVERANATLDRVARGAAFLKPRHLSGKDYFDWLVSRPETVIRLCHTATVLCVNDLPKTVGGTLHDKDLGPMVVEIDAVAEIYEYAKDEEVACHEIVPPEQFETLHRETYGWSEPVQKGIDQCIEILRQIARMDRTAVRKGEVETPEFKITIEPPDKLETFTDALSTVDVATMYD